ncbi:MAG TPA: hypothetical protein VM599_10310, partial [Thermoanaerobaculia bacterium]|nr:hypothetical protein [Thermoanaerobaculia bacterium]
TFSPDGRWITYTAGGGGPPEVFVSPVGREGRWQISRNGGFAPRWSRSGREIVYFEPPNRLMAVDVITEDGFRAGPPNALFALPQAALQGGGYAIEPGGERILLPLATGQAATPPLRLVLHWPRLLPR